MRLDHARLTRRSYVALAGAGTLGFAGCTSDDGDNRGATGEPTPAEGATTTPRAEPTATETPAPETDPEIAPSRVLWGTDVGMPWHVENAVMERFMAFTEDVLEHVPERHHAAYKRENALELFGL